MSITILDGPTVTGFVEDRDAFNRYADDLFTCLDTDGDGLLSRSELIKGFDGLLSSSSGVAAEPLSPTTPSVAKAVEASVFDRFDGDGSGGVDRDEFRAEMREVMLAVASGIGDSPVQVVLGGDSFLMRAVEHEASAKATV